jgi:hypothetical protein
MPSLEHESLVMLFRNRPSLATDLLHDVLKVSDPAYDEAHIGSEDLTELVPDAYRADAVVVCEAAKPVLSVVVEIQRGKDPGKRWSWPMYLVSLRSRMKCPTILLVICVDPAVARWCASPIELGHPGLVLTPLVIGPDLIPMVTDPAEAAQSPELAALSAMTHADRPGGEKVLHALVTAATIPGSGTYNYLDLMIGVLPTAARRYLEELMTVTGTQGPFSDFAKRYQAEGEARGEARGEAKAIVAVLAARNIPVTEEARGRINECTDLDQLDTWIRRAATVDSLEALFDGPSHGEPYGGEEFGAAGLQAAVGEAAEGPGQEHAGRQADRDGGPPQGGQVEDRPGDHQPAGR